jgi:hypothetical protein
VQVGNLVLKRGAYKHDGIRGAGGGPIPAQNNKGSDKWFGGRGFCIEGYMPPGSPTTTNIIQYLSIGVGGMSIDFGDGTHSTDGANMCDGDSSNGVRIVYAPGYRSGPGNNSPVKQYFNALVHSNAIDFGDMVTTSWPHGAVTNGSRVMESAGDYTNKNTEFFNIGTPANAIQDNDQLQAGAARSGLTDGSRGVFVGGRDSGGGFTNSMEYFQIQAAYSGTDFDELATSNYFFTTLNSSGGRCLVVGGGTQPNSQIKCFNLQNSAASFDFGELSTNQAAGAGATDGVRGHTSAALGSAGDWGTPTTNSVEYINIYTRGNATDYGEQIQDVNARQSRGSSAA